MKRLMLIGAGLAGAALLAACGGSASDLTSGADAAAGAAGSGGASAGSCKNSLDCDGDQVCDPSSRRCVECVTNDDCPSGLRCGATECRAPCQSDKQCTGQGKLCDPANGWCYTPGSGGTGGGTGGAGGTDGGTGGAAGGCPGPVDAMILLDRSASMDHPWKWQPAVDAVKSFATTTPAWLGLGFVPVSPTVAPPSPACDTDEDCGEYGPCLQVFQQCSGALGSDWSSCIAADYATPRVALAVPATAQASIIGEVSAAEPNGISSTLTPALEGIIDYTRGFVGAHSGHSGIVLFINDGDPNGCTTNTVSSLAAAAAAGLAGSPRIKTFVITLGAPSDPLDSVAFAGGTGVATSVPAIGPEATEAIRAALAAAVAGACD